MKLKVTELNNNGDLKEEIFENCFMNGRIRQDFMFNKFEYCSFDTYKVVDKFFRDKNIKIGSTMTTKILNGIATIEVISLK